MKLPQFDRHDIMSICEIINDRKADPNIWDACERWNNFVASPDEYEKPDKNYHGFYAQEWKVTGPDGHSWVSFHGCWKNQNYRFFLIRRWKDDEFPMLVYSLS